MKKYVVVALGLLAAQHVFAQDELVVPKKNKHLQYNSAVKVYSEISYQESFMNKQVYQNNLYGKTTVADFLRPTVAYQWRNKKGNFNEIELNRFSIAKENSVLKLDDTLHGITIIVDGAIKYTTNVSMRYEHIIQFCKSSNARLVPSLGLAANPYYVRGNNIPKTTSSFQVINAEAGFRIFAVPRLSYYFSKKFYLDLNIPLCFTNISWKHQDIRNTALSRRQQRYNVMNMEMFPKFISARIGLGMKI